MHEYNTFDILLYLLLCIVIVSLGLVICRKLYINTRNEERKEKGKVIQRIMKNYCVVQCGVWPFISVMFGIVRFTWNSAFAYNHQTLVIIIVSSLRSLFRLNLGYVGFHSFVTATCRYVFIMYATHDEYTSVRKIRKFFITMSFMVPIMLWVFNEAIIAYPEISLPIVRFQIHADSNIIGQSNVTGVEGTLNSVMDTPEQPSFLISSESPLFLVVEKYLSTSIISGFKVALYVIHFIFYSNIPEGVLYTHLFIANSR